MFAPATPFSDSQPRLFADFPGAVIYSPAGYVPQIAAVWTASALRLPVEATVRLGRILNAALTLFLFLLALRIAPAGRLFLLLLALMPMTAAMAASLGQDGLVLGTCAVAIALALRARRERRWSRRALLLLAACGAVLALTKIVYVPLILLALFPLPSGAARARWLGAPLALTFASAVLAFAWLRGNAASVVRHAPGIPDPGGQIAFLKAHPADFLVVLSNTAVERSGWIAMSAFNFGWLTVGPVILAAVLAGGALAAAWWRGEPAEALPDRAWRSWAAALTLVVTAAVAATMYIAATPVAEPIVHGLQGRYLLPLLPVVLLVAARRRGRWSGPWAAILALLLLGAADLAALAAIGRAFYTV
jgi:uncharacterized membrane protein